MTTETKLDDQTEGPVLADGVDEEPVEHNRRIFDGRTYLIIAGVSAFYALFHMAALNGWSIRGWTGVNIPFLPVFPMETWNFRIVHIAGALILGFMLYSARAFPDTEDDKHGVLDYLAYVALLPALYACYTALSFAAEIQGGVMWNGIDEGIRAAETYHYGLPLLVATVAAIVLGWFRPRVRGTIAPADLVLSVCAIALLSCYVILQSNK